MDNYADDLLPNICECAIINIPFAFMSPLIHMRKEVANVCRLIDSYKDEMVRCLTDLCSIPAISPKSGGEGESKKADWLVANLKRLGFKKIERYDSPDREVPSGKRPNIVVRVPGRDRSRTIWVVTHTDVVPAGDLKKWSIDPFKPVLKGDKIIGRGVEDNGQELVASLYALKAVLDCGFKPKYDVALAFVADEEVGSTHGIKYLLSKGIFSGRDIIIVPDAGMKRGEKIEVAEKTGLWIKVTTLGKQTHGASPYKGRNAHKAAAALVCALDVVLYKKFVKEDKLFQYPLSTFEPTKKEPNVPNINTVPGEDVYYMDCRLLPSYKPEDVMDTIRIEAKTIGRKYGVRFRFEIVNGGKGSPPTSTESEAFIGLSDAVEEVRGFRPEPFGIGGGTCAALFRRAGFPAVVWTTSDEVPHTPDEYIWVKNLTGDAKVYAALFL
jgi:succinyl-diaminopimelate desuccinylase